MNKSIRRILFMSCVIVLSSVIVLSVLNVRAKLTAEENKAKLPATAQPQLTSNPRQVLTSTAAPTNVGPAKPASATFSCNIQHGGLTSAEIESYKGPNDCTDLSPQTITESTLNNFTYSGGRISWWREWTYGTMSQGQGTCANLPLVVQSAMPLSYIRLRVYCKTLGTVTFTPNDGAAVQLLCPTAGQGADAFMYGNTITQVTITSVPNDGLFINPDWGAGFIAGIEFRQGQPCDNCPTIPTIP